MGPYDILGVSASATDEEIAGSYRKLARLYHPDINPGNDQAARKMAEINNAYDEIKQIRSGKANQTNDKNSYYQNSYYQNAYSNTNNQNNQYQFVKQLINTGQVFSAMAWLANNRQEDGEWYFLYSICLANSRRLDDAKRYVRRALQLDPYNQKYQDLLNKLMEHQTQANANVSPFSRAFFTVLKWVFYLYLFRLFINFIASGMGRG